MSNFHNKNSYHKLQQKCINRDDANIIAAFDSVTVNWDRANPDAGLPGENRDNLLFRPDPSGWKMTMIDHGYCFGARWDTHMPPVFPHSIGAWPNQIFGIFWGLARLGWYDEAQMMSALHALQRLTLSDVLQIIQEVPGSWKTFTSDVETTQLATALLTRTANYGAIIRARYATSYASAQRG